MPTVSLVLLLYLYFSPGILCLLLCAAVCVPQAFVSACDAACRMRSDPTSSSSSREIYIYPIHMTGRDAINLSYKRYSFFGCFCDGLQQRTCYIINYLDERRCAPMDSFYNIFAHQSWKRPYHQTHTFHIYLELNV